MTAPATATGTETRPVGPHVVIASEETAAALAPVLHELPPLPGAVLVLAAAPDAAPVLRGALPDLVGLARERGATGLVLAASGLAAPAPDGRRPVASVARTARFTVIAPDGTVSVEPDGTLRVDEQGSWWLAAPGEEPYDLGPGWPPLPEPGPPAPPEASEEPEVSGESEVSDEPEEEQEEAYEEDPLPPPPPPVPVRAESGGGAHAFDASPLQGPPVQETAEETDGGRAADGRAADGLPGEEAGEDTRAVPGGVWLGTPPRAIEPLIGAAPDTYLLGVGSPDRPALPAGELLDRVPADAAAARHLLLAAPWADPADLVAMATALADDLGRTVRAAVGLPVRTADDHATTFLDGRGAPTWQPLLVELAASPDRHRVAPSAWLRLSGPEEAGPARYACADVADWTAEAVPAGLWLRPAGGTPDPAPRTRRPDPARPVLVVGDGEHPLPPGLRGALPGLLAALPDLGATEPYGLVLHGTASDEDTVRTWAEELSLHHRPPAPAPTPVSVPVRDPAPEPPTREAPPPAPELPAPEPPASAPPVSEPPAPEPPVPAPVPPAASVPAPAPGGRSGPDDRAALRALLGEKYHILASKTELLASRLPSLRSLAQDGLKPDLVAIALYQDDAGDLVTREGLAAAARAAAPGPLTPLLRCLDSGLRRLPGHYGAVMLAAPMERVPLDRYAPGTVLVEPAAVATVPACDAELEGAVEFGVWSTTGRRTSVFLGTDDEPEVVFPPGTAFSVLDLCLPEDEAAPIRVLLREISAAEARPEARADERFRKRDDQARTRLTEWFERRDMLEPADRRPLPDAARFHVAPGAVPPLP
ncbi:hypothetical protein [Streptomyces termitum]|uniref:hypothetical protein n=1 Tax=Streptomyces termitum TaxID=67368 RepID=UPI00378EAEBE